MVDASPERVAASTTDASTRSAVHPSASSDPSAAANPDRAVERPRDLSSGGWSAVARRVRLDLREHNTGLLAAGIAFRGFLAMFPTVIVVTSGLALAQPGDEIVRQSRRLTLGLPVSARDVIIEQVEAITTAGVEELRLALLVALALAVWTSTTAMDGVVEGLTVANGERDERSWWHRRLLAMALTVGAFTFLSTTLGIVTGFPALFRRLGLEGIANSAAVTGQFILLGVMMFGGLVVLYRRGPDRTPARWQWVVPGALVATGLWLIGTEAFAQFVERVGEFTVRYGAVAGIVVLMLWLLLTAWCVLFGATINAELEHETLVDTTVGESKPFGERGAVPADTAPRGPLRWRVDTPHEVR